MASTTLARLRRTWRWSSQSKRPKSTAPASFVYDAPATPDGSPITWRWRRTQGLIGMGAVSVGSATTTLYGGMKPITGTNPIAFGIPARDGKHIILDFATASMSMGELQKARSEERADSRRHDARRSRQADYRFQNFSRAAARGVFALRRLQGLGRRAELPKSSAAMLSGNGLGKSWWNKGATASTVYFCRHSPSKNSRSSITFTTESTN